MEDAHHHHHHDQYLLWVQKRREILMMNSINGSSSSSSSSWEEKAFSEDLHAAAGSLGGCVWPPRSYTCSFCMREFKSAQALGGHMNIHRRDRARLKQYCLLSPHSSSTSHENIIPNHDHHQYSLKLDPVNISRPSTTTSTYNITNTSSRAFSTNYCGSRVSAEHPFVPSTLSDHHHGNLSAKNPRKEESYVETNLCVGLNSAALGRTDSQPVISTSSTSSPTGLFRGDVHREHDEMTGNYKRPKLMSFFLKPCRLQSNQVVNIHDEITEAAGNSMEDLDLELRLGETPKVK